MADWQHSGPELRDRVAAALPGLRAFAIPMRTRFRGITVREGALIEGPAGWAAVAKPRLRPGAGLSAQLFVQYFRQPYSSTG